MSSQSELVADAKALLGEGPSWDSARNCLYWVDILAGKLFAFSPADSRNVSWDLGQYVGAAVPRSSGGLVVACQQGFAMFDLESGKLTMICDPEHHFPGNRFNDGKCDPSGRFWAGTMSIDNPIDQGSLYRLDHDLEAHKMLDNIGISNGLAWSSDQKTMYYVDSTKWTIVAFDFDQDSGALFNPRIVIEVPRNMGCADGMTIDVEGMLWVAHYGGGRICRWDPFKSRLLESVILPVSLTTSCTFGGPAFDTLFITSASAGLDHSQRKREPHAGGLFCLKPGVAGLPTHQFGG